MVELTIPLEAVVTSGHFSTRTGPLSTQPGARSQLRDPVFVTDAAAGSYITTGVETRTSVDCRPLARRAHLPGAHPAGCNGLYRPQSPSLRSSLHAASIGVLSPCRFRPIPRRG